MTTNQELRKLAMDATPIETDLYGDRYFQGPYSNAVLNKAQDAFFTAANPAKVIELLDRIDRLEAENEAKDRLLVQALEAMQKASFSCYHEDSNSAYDTLDPAMEAIAQHLKGTP